MPWEAVMHRTEHQPYVCLKSKYKLEGQRDSEVNTYHHIVVPKKFQLSQIDSSYRGKETSNITIKTERERGRALLLPFMC